MNFTKSIFCILKTDIAWSLQNLGIISEYEVPLNLNVIMSLLKVDDMINNSFRKSFLSSLDWFLAVKIDSEKANFAYLMCMVQCQFSKYNDFLGVC